jgi:hypothetical protein
MGSTQVFRGGAFPSFLHHRALLAAVVAATGGTGFAVGALLALIRGDFPPPRATIAPGYAELSRDFAALDDSELFAALGETPAPFKPPGETAITGAAVTGAAVTGAAVTGAAPTRRACGESTWPFFDQDCLWGDGATQGVRRRKRIVSRLKSPWCSGLLSKEGAYICRPRT